MGRLIPRILFTTTVFFAVVVAIPPVMADNEVEQVRKLRNTDSILPLSQTLTKIETSYPGTLLDVELEYEDAKFIYEIEILNAKHIVQEVKVDATTGKILTTEHD